MTKTPDYNDGAIHWWDSYLWPEGLHLSSTVKVSIGNSVHVQLVSEVYWGHITAFQVISEYVEHKPLEIWVNVYKGGYFGDICETAKDAYFDAEGRSETRTVHFVAQPEEKT
tara:strand:- start:402 stop:737 length:336 start_codon:yes stop_codon:yes gene_type:complete